MEGCCGEGGRVGVAAESPRAADKRGGRDSGGEHIAQGLCAVLLSVLSVRVRVTVCILCACIWMQRVWSTYLAPSSTSSHGHAQAPPGRPSVGLLVRLGHVSY